MKKTILLLVIFPLWVYSAQPLNWQACVQEATARNLDVLSAYKNISKIETELGISRATYLPSVTLTGAYAQTSSTSTGTGSLSLTQKLFPGLTDKPEEQRAQLHIKQAQLHLQETLATLKSDLATAFAQLSYAQEWIKLAQTISQRRSQNANLVHTRYLAGREHKGSYLRAQAQADEAMLEVTQAKRDLGLAQDTLSVLLDRPFEALIVTGSIPTSVLPQNPNILALAAESPTILYSQSQTTEAQINQTITQQSYLPDVAASYSLSHTLIGSNSSDGTGRLAISIPLFDAGKGSYDTTSATLAVTLSQLSEKKIRNQTTLSLRKAWATALSTLEDGKIQDNLVKVALIRSEIAQAQYNTGILSFDNWDIIENDLISQQKLALISKKNIATSMAEFERILGIGF